MSLVVISEVGIPSRRDEAEFWIKVDEEIYTIIADNSWKPSMCDVGPGKKGRLEN